MTDTKKLRIAIINSELSRQQIADLMGISLYTFQKKLHNKTEFKTKEVAKLTKILGLSVEERDTIFFAQIVD